jgi:tetratricopeptide (TPR) repeat protein
MTGRPRKRVRPKRRLTRFWVVALVMGGGALSWWGWSRLAPSLTARGAAAYKRSDWREASRLAQERLKAAKDDPQALRLLARAEARLGNFQEARSLFARLDEPDMEAEDYCLLALGLTLSGDPIEAQTVLQQALSADPDHSESLHLLALVAFQRSQWVEATRAAERLAHRHDWAARANLVLGMIGAADNNPAGAVRSLQLALSQDPSVRLVAADPFSTRRLLARSLLQAGRPAEARDVLSALLRKAPDHEAEWLLSRAYLQEGKPAEAAAALKRSDTYRAEHPLEPEPAPYVGQARCAECHAGIEHAVLASGHARTYQAGRDLAGLPLPESPLMDPDNPQVSHAFKRVDGQVQLETRTPDKVLRAVVDYALGSNDRYTSLIGHDEQGQVRTLRPSYYRSTKGSGWDRTKGHAVHPKRADEFLGELFASDDERQGCLVCHTTSARAARERKGPEANDRAIGCERCHGPGGLHLAAVAVKFSDSAIASPARALPREINQSCGECHSQHFLAMPASRTAPDWTRFPGSTLEWSRCYTESGGALSCVTCHDPHRNAETAPAYYEAKCLSCHATSAPSTKAPPARPHQGEEAFRSPCPVNPSRDCLQCHMPKVRYDWLHASFTDHYIRVHTDKE